MFLHEKRTVFNKSETVILVVAVIAKNYAVKLHKLTIRAISGNQDSGENKMKFIFVLCLIAIDLMRAGKFRYEIDHLIIDMRLMQPMY